MKLIKLSSDHYIIVDDSEIKVGDFITDNYRVWQWQDDSSLLGRKKVIYSTNAMYKDEYISLSEVKELLGDVDVEKKAYDYVNKKDFSDDAFRGYKAGYNQALEDNKGKVYTEEDIIKVVRLSLEDAEKSVLWSKEYPKILANRILQSLQHPTSWDVEFVNGKFKLK